MRKLPTTTLNFQDEDRPIPSIAAWQDAGLSWGEEPFPEPIRALAHARDASVREFADSDRKGRSVGTAMRNADQHLGNSTLFAGDERASA